MTAERPPMHGPPDWCDPEDETPPSEYDTPGLLEYQASKARYEGNLHEAVDLEWGAFRFKHETPHPTSTDPWLREEYWQERADLADVELDDVATWAAEIDPTADVETFDFDRRLIGKLDRRIDEKIHPAVHWARRSRQRRSPRPGAPRRTTRSRSTSRGPPSTSARRCAARCNVHGRRCCAAKTACASSTRAA